MVPWQRATDETQHRCQRCVMVLVAGHGPEIRRGVILGANCGTAYQGEELWCQHWCLAFDSCVMISGRITESATEGSHYI